MSPITVTLRVPRAAAPIPWKKRRARSRSKSRAKAQAPPARPKRRRAGTKIFFLPKRSERMPRSGVITMPGSVKNVIRSPTCPLEMPNSCTMVGKAGVTLEVPRTHQSYAPQYVEVVVLIDPANALVSLSLRSHDRKIYQVVCSEVGSGAHSKHATPFGLRLSARRLAGPRSQHFSFLRSG